MGAGMRQYRRLNRYRYHVQVYDTLVIQGHMTKILASVYGRLPQRPRPLLGSLPQQPRHLWGRGIRATRCPYWETSRLDTEIIIWFAPSVSHVRIWTHWVSK